jgi:uncharacterized protein YndB with AHSA1/START domain
MKASDSHEKDAVRIDRLLPATPEEVFDAWTDPKSLSKFMCPNEVLRARVQADVRVGGQFQIDMVNKNDETKHTGKYVEIDRPRKLAFTWRSKHTDNRDSLVTLYFTPDGDETRILLVHEQLPDAEARRKHTGGWTSVIDHLDQYERGVKSTDDFQTTLRLAAPPSAVYAALTTPAGLAGWWTQTCTVGSKAGDQNDFRFPGPDFSARFEITRLVPDSLVEWKCVDNTHPPQAGYKNPHDWIGTTVRFQLQPIDPASTQLTFTHVGLSPSLECNTSCRNGWWHYLHQSLRSYIATGQGLPHPADGTKA